MQRPLAEYQRLISRSQPFLGLPNEMLTALLERMEERAFVPDEKLIRQDDPGDYLFLILEGTATVHVQEGESLHEVATVGSGDVVGEMALISGEKRSADVVGGGPGRVLALSADDFHALCRRFPQIAVVLTRLIADRLGRAESDALGGKVVEDYRIVRCIGRGGMSVVYEATRLADGGRVALKMMSHGLIYDMSALGRFQEEADLLEKLDHENLARLYGRFSAYGTSFLVMEFCDGPVLQQIVSRRKPLPEELVRPLTGQLAQALDYVHEHGVIHRDIKPSNVMLTSTGRVKLMDFGVARPTLRIDESTQTQMNALVGTPYYMAPEQLRSSGLDERSDIYAMASITYELLSGDRLFAARDIYAMLRDKMSFKLPPREKIGHGISEAMHAFLLQNMHPDPAKRAKTLAEQAHWAAPVNVPALTA